MSRRRYLPPHEVEIDRLGKKGLGMGRASDGRDIAVRGAPPGSRVLVQPFKRKKNTWHGRRLALIRPPLEQLDPVCPAFGLCGGCSLQELPLEVQQRHKYAYALGEVAAPLGLEVAALREQVKVHELRSTGSPYAYRNKVELTFGTARYLSEADLAAGEPIDGSFLGFHASGRFDRVVDRDSCAIASPPIDRVVQAVREVALKEGAPPCWNPRQHTGFWRHLRIRVGQQTGEVLVGLYTAPANTPEERAAAFAVGEALLSDDLGATLTGVVWFENPSHGDAAKGEIAKVWGQSYLRERIGKVMHRVSMDAFFQVNTPGAEVLVEAVGEALGPPARVLYDLYCGIGTFGLQFADRYEEMFGIEEVEVAIEDAHYNAEQNGVSGVWRAARVEAVLESIEGGEGVHLLVDPPRAGLHPKAAAAFAATQADVLVYVACKPGALGRDAVALTEGGWRLTDLWAVDLFPQTGHLEMIGRFVR